MSSIILFTLASRLASTLFSNWVTTSVGSNKLVGCASMFCDLDSMLRMEALIA